jgi:predicted AAA+ superfamily ATPase
MLAEKESLLSSFIGKALAEGEARARRLTGGSAGESFESRDQFDAIRSAIERFRGGNSAVRWLTMPGLRGTGKTTLLGQTYVLLRSRGVPQNQILLVSVDEAGMTIGASILDLLGAYERYVGIGFSDMTPSSQTYLLFDEVQSDPDWAAALKILHDQTDRVFVISTGSSATALTTTADAARRSLSIPVPPLTFTEFLRLGPDRAKVGGSRRTLSDAIMSADSAEDAFSKLERERGQLSEELTRVRPFSIERYLRTGTLPFIMPVEDEASAYSMVNATVSKVVCQDLAQFKSFDRNTQLKATQFLTMVAVSDQMSLESLSRNLGVTRVTITEIVDALEGSGVISRVERLGSESAKVRRMPKYKFTAPSMRAATLFRIGRLTNTSEVLGWLFEDVSALYLRASVREGRVLRFEYDPEEGGADFVLSRPDGSRLVLEVGYGHKGHDQIIQTSEKVRSRYGILVSDGPLAMSNDGSIVSVPREWFLMSA